MTVLADLDRYLKTETPIPGAPRKNKMTIDGDGEGFGGFVSVLYKPFDDWAFGAHYQSPVSVKLTGETKYRHNSDSYMNMVQFINTDVKAHVTIPGYLALGVKNSTFDKLDLFFDVVWTQWSAFDQLDIHFDNMPASGKPGMARSQHKYHDTLSYRFGAEYKLNETWTLRAGYLRDIGAANDRYRSPLMPDSSKHLFTVGCGYNRENWSIDLAYGYTLFDDCKLGSALAAENKIARGDFNTDVHLLSAQVTYRF